MGKPPSSAEDWREEWEQIIIHTAISGGWTIEYARWHIDLPMLQSLTTYWGNHPPVHILVAGYLGYKKPDVTTPAKPSFDDFLASVSATYQPPGVPSR